MACRSSPTGKPPPTLQRQPHTANNTQAVSSPHQEGPEAAGSSWHLACLQQDSLSSDCSVFPCDVSNITEIPGSALCHHHFLKITDSRSPAAFQVPAMRLSPLNTHGHMNTHRYTHTRTGTHVDRQAHILTHTCTGTGVVLKRLGGVRHRPHALLWRNAQHKWLSCWQDSTQSACALCCLFSLGEVPSQIGSHPLTAAVWLPPRRARPPASSPGPWAGGRLCGRGRCAPCTP